MIHVESSCEGIHVCVGGREMGDGWEGRKGKGGWWVGREKGGRVEGKWRKGLCMHLQQMGASDWLTLEIPGAIRSPAATPLWNSTHWRMLAGLSMWSRPTAAFLRARENAPLAHSQHLTEETKLCLPRWNPATEVEGGYRQRGSGEGLSAGQAEHPPEVEVGNTQR